MDPVRQLQADAVVTANPFVGLRPFSASDRMQFFGRREQVSDLLRKLRQSRFLAAVGGSGCGKSSLIKAGLIPALRGGFLVAERDSWHVVEMTPGDRPIRNLAAALLTASGKNAGPIETAELEKDLVKLRTKRIVTELQPALANNLNVLLLIDQFEELFRYKPVQRSEAHEARSAFVAGVLGLTKLEMLPIYIVCTMRSDFIGDCDAFTGLPEILNRGLYLVPRLTRQQRREAIEGPILRQGASISLALLDRILNESESQPDQLPILQHALLRTWDVWCKEVGSHVRDGDEPAPVDITHYEKAGTLSGALDKDAKEALQQSDQALTRRIFETLTDTDEANRQVRNPARMSELRAITGADDRSIEGVISVFSENRRCFLVKSNVGQAADPIVDISHESLIRQWTNLSNWVTKAAESAAIYRRLEEATFLRQSMRESLYSGPRLQIALDWERENRPDAVWANRVRSRVRISNSPQAAGGPPPVEHSDKPAAKWLVWSRKLKAGVISLLGWRKRAGRNVGNPDEAIPVVRPSFKQVIDFLHRSRKARARRRWALGFVLLSALLVSTLYNKSLNNQVMVDHLASEARNLYPAAPERSLLLLAEALQIADAPFGWTLPRHEQDKTGLPKAFGATLRRVDAAMRAVLPVATAQASEVGLRNTLSDVGGQGLGTLDAPIQSVAISPDRESRWLVSCAANGTVMLADLAAQSPIKNRKLVEGVREPCVTCATVVASATDRVAIGYQDGRIEVVSDLSRQRLTKFLAVGGSEKISAVGLSPDGRWLLAGDSKGEAWRWDLSQEVPQPLAFPPPHDKAFLTAWISPDGGTALTRDVLNRVIIWNVSGQPAIVRNYEVRADPYDISADGRWVIKADENGISRFEAARQLSEELILGSSETVAPVNLLKIGPGSNWLAFTTQDGVLHLLQRPLGTGPHPPRLLAPLHGHDGPVRALDFSANGHWLVSGGEDGSLRLWDLKSPDPSNRSVRHRGDHRLTTSTDLTLDGHWLALGYLDGATSVWNLEDDSLIEVKKPPHGGEPVLAVRITSNGRWLYRKSFHGSGTSQEFHTELWDLLIPQQAHLRSPEKGGVIGIDPNGKSLVSSDRGHVYVWSLGKGQISLRQTLEYVENDAASEAFFSPTGRYLAVSDLAGRLFVWDLNRRTSDSRIAFLPGTHTKDRPPQVTAVAFDNGERWLAIGRSDGTVSGAFLASSRGPSLFDLPRQHSEAVTAVLLFAVSNEVERVISAGTDGAAVMFDVGRRGYDGTPGRQRNFEGHQGAILAARATGDGTKLLTMGQDATARLWDLRERHDEPVILKGPEGAITTGTFTRNERALLTVSVDGTVREWTLNREDLRRAAERVVGRNLTCEEWRRYNGNPSSSRMDYAFQALDPEGKRSVECPEN